MFAQRYHVGITGKAYPLPSGEGSGYLVAHTKACGVGEIAVRRAPPPLRGGQRLSFLTRKGLRGGGDSRAASTKYRWRDILHSPALFHEPVVEFAFTVAEVGVGAVEVAELFFTDYSAVN